MQIRLKTISGEEFTMEVLRESQVLQFRRDVALKLNVEYDRIRLIFAGQVLNDAEAIDKYEIFDGSVVHAVVRPVNSVPSAASVTNEATIPSTRTNSEANSAAPYFHIFPGSFEMSAEEARSANIPEIGFGNSLSMMMGPMALSMGDVNTNGRVGGSGGGGEGTSSASMGHPPGIGMDALFSNMLMGSLAGAPNTGSGTRNSRTILKAKEPHFGNTVESGLSSIRCIKYDGDNSTYYNSNNVNHDILFEDIDPRLDDPSMAIAQMLSELGTCLKGLEAPLLKMSEKMQTGEFIQCATSTQRINRQSEISNMKVTLQNLAVAAQQTARSLVLLSVEVVPGIQPALRPSVPFAAAAAAARVMSGRGREGPARERPNTNPAVVPTVAVSAAGTKTAGTKNESVAKIVTAGSVSPSSAAASNKSAPGQSMKLAKGFLNRPSKSAATSSTSTAARPIVSKIPENKNSSFPIISTTSPHPMGGTTHDSDSCPELYTESSDSDNCRSRKKAATTAASAVKQSTATSATGSTAGKVATGVPKTGSGKPINSTSPSGRPASSSVSSSSHFPNGAMPTHVCPIFAAEAMSWYFGGREENNDDDDDDNSDNENARRMREMYFYQMTNDPEFREMMRRDGIRFQEESEKEDARKEAAAAEIKEKSRKKAAALKLVASKEKEKELKVSSTSTTNAPLSSSSSPAIVASISIPILMQESGQVSADCGSTPIKEEDGTSSDAKTTASAALETPMTGILLENSEDRGAGELTFSTAPSLSPLTAAAHTRISHSTPFNWSPRCRSVVSPLTGISNVNPLVRRKYNATKAMPTVPLRPLLSSSSSLIIPKLSDSSGVNVVKRENDP